MAGGLTATAAWLLADLSDDMLIPSVDTYFIRAGHWTYLTTLSGISGLGKSTSLK